MLSDSYLPSVYFEVFCDHSAIAQILNGKKKNANMQNTEINRALTSLSNSIVQYLPGEKMHIADILSRLSK